MGLGWSVLTAISTDPSARAVPALGRDDIWEGRLCSVVMTEWWGRFDATLTDPQRMGGDKPLPYDYKVRNL
jgi:hypothetical protein